MFKRISFFLITLVFVLGTSTAAWSDDFYEGKSIKLIVPYPPGGGTDTFSRLVARYMPTYIPGKPTIIVQNILGASGIVALNYLYNIAKPDGLTIGHTSVPGVRDQLVGAEGVKHDYATFEYIGSGGPTLQLLAIRSALPYKSYADLKKADKTLFMAAGSVASTQAVLAAILRHEGVPIKVVTGYRGSAPRVQALVKGEADSTTVILMQIKQEKESLRPIFWVSVKGPELTDLPRLEELPLSAETRSFIKAVTAPLTAARTFLAPPKTPKDRLRILQKAFEQTIKSDEFMKVATKLNLGPRYFSAKETRDLYVSVLNTPPKSVATLKRILKKSQ